MLHSQNSISPYCNVSICQYCTHGFFPECKRHFKERHLQGNKSFTWSPASVGFATLTRILSCYPDIFDISPLKEEDVRYGAKSVIILGMLRSETLWRGKITDLISGGITQNSIMIPLSQEKNMAVSKPVRVLLGYFKQRGVSFETEKKFPGMKYYKSLRIDIFVPFYKGINRSIAIEYDGDFPGSHFVFTNEAEKEKHYLTVKRDKLKDNFVLENGMHLIRIPYVNFSYENEGIIIEELEKALGVLALSDSPTLVTTNDEIYRERDEKLASEKSKASLVLFQEKTIVPARPVPDKTGGVIDTLTNALKSLFVW